VKPLSQQSLGRYEIDAEIGRGAMGIVYRARDPKIDRTVAIKTISLAGQELADERAYRERFVQEARAAGRLSHPGIVTIFDAGEETGTHEPYLVMEYIAGEPLSKIMSGEDRKLPLPAALQFAQEIAEALDYAHSQGVIHRDIKPANILITQEGHAKIADFGVARLNQELITQTGQIFGSPAYMAPEQLSGRPADARSDLFSLGVILYSMITGFRPFQGNSAQTVCFKVMNIEPVPVTSLQHELPSGLDAIISRAIAKDPDERYQSGSELACDIQAFRETDISPAETTSGFTRAIHKDSIRWDRRRQDGRAFHQRFFWSTAVFAFILAILVTGWKLTGSIRSAAAIQPPSVPVQSAPIIEKTRRTFTIRYRNTKGPVKKEPVKLEAVPTPTAKVQVEIQHHFNAAKASIWLDDQLVFDQNLRGPDQRHPLLRSVEMNQIASFQFASGKHQLQIRVVSPANTYDQIETLDADLSPGSEHVLRVNCDRRKMLVALQ
jgi:serine/threonine protein kinase